MAQGLPHPAGGSGAAVSETRRPSLAAALTAAVAVLAAIYPLAYVTVALLRMGHPFELEWLEGGSLDQVRRILDGQPVYTRPSAAYVAFPYAPLYYYAAAAVAALTGPGFTALRLVSFLASLVSLGILFALVRRETGRMLPAVVAAGAFAGTYRAAGAWLDVGRVDSLYLALTLAAVWLVRSGRTGWSQAAAGALLCLAFLTKQVAVVALLAFALHHLLWRRCHAAALLGTAAAGIVGATLLMDYRTQGWFTFHVYRPHGVLPHRFLTFWWGDLLPLSVAILGGVLLLAVRRRLGPERWRFYATFAAAMVGTGLLARMIVGAYLNALLPAFAGLAVLLGLALHEAQALLPAPADERRAPLEGALLGAVLLQLVLLAWDPRARIPGGSDRQAGERLLARLRGLGTSVVVPSHPYLAARATGHAHAHAMAIGDLLYFAPGPVGDALERDLRDALCTRRYSAIVTNGTWRYEAELGRYYGAAQPLPELGDAFWPVTGARTRPSALYLPREAAVNTAGEAAACRPEASRPAGSS
jgi:hypothetical protein